MEVDIQLNVKTQQSTIAEKKNQLVFLLLAAGLVKHKLVAELTFKDCGEEGGAERESCAFQSMRLF